MSTTPSRQRAAVNAFPFGSPAALVSTQPTATWPGPSTARAGKTAVRRAGTRILCQCRPLSDDQASHSAIALGADKVADGGWDNVAPICCDQVTKTVPLLSTATGVKFHRSSCVDPVTDEPGMCVSCQVEPLSAERATATPCWSGQV